ncbi:MAG: 30S ribosomal protein S14 [Ignavibacteria bacterium GWB2_35_12]|nr:MAG: 30S ribosomal protein S14 [Ignavibacteria bacterium GWA2_35_8]OGU39771.1 MAG: 30S ribosomal protein S14 [Ignavibacteria bacterium GWB2_35_12]OGU95542.1 MAG: 30S ribosomal protein S14 [Ignavibacteria bacterium RIFOXYA2_FULL_35_10]OGV21338.1 MAG: 30S ribosomal protein S14 [Ignavibacteria bacterium RIFOXYC2_FULL_35_21]
MSTTAIVARNNKRIRLAEKYAQKRAELKKLGDYEGLQKLPRNSSPTRIRSRCSVTGRGRGVYKRFGLCRHMFRQLALEGKIPGIRKASW